jgi:hypothetical protein
MDIQKNRKTGLQISELSEVFTYIPDKRLIDAFTYTPDERLTDAFTYTPDERLADAFTYYPEVYKKCYPYGKTKSEKFLQTATELLAKEFVRLGGLSTEDSMVLSAEIIPGIDWENWALMHKGFGWIAKNYLRKQANSDTFTVRLAGC